MQGSVPMGQIVVLNGAPRSGKSSIASAIQERGSGLWMNVGVDVARAMTPPRYQPGNGLRPGEEMHPAASVVPVLYAALYDSIAAHSRLGLNVVVDVGHHVEGILSDCARRVAGLPVIFVGVRCPIEVIIERRYASTPGKYATAKDAEPIPLPVLRWQQEVHAHKYDLEVDTSVASPDQCADAILRRLQSGPPPTAFPQLAL
jgi:chloramphenicol 3-O phosphotransferase